jgi:putative ATP-dependent endonuclease of the OLD family
MIIERLILTNFRCFGPEPQTIELAPGMTAFVGANGAGKTAVMQALLRLFGVTSEQRRLRRQDFHVPVDEESPPATRTLSLEVILGFPELQEEDLEGSDAIPEFFHHMAADDGGTLKCRLRLDAAWTDDGSLEGAIDAKNRAIRTLDIKFTENDCSDLKASDRARIQIVYVPALRDATSQVTSFLRGRLWRAVTWSGKLRDVLSTSGDKLNAAFAEEAGVGVIADAIDQRWKELHSAGTDTSAILRPVDSRLQAFIRKVDVVFRPDETGLDRGIEDLSDGQRSLFHIALTAATLDIEAKISSSSGEGFQADAVVLPSLTLLALEEPENNLAPFYLSRIVRQLESLTGGSRAQAVISSHSASILARVDPAHVRHFRLDHATRTACVRGVHLADEEEEAGKFIREAVRTYPEMYFARFVILGEGSSEEIVLPRLADALGLPIDRSFVAVVPLGGRHVNHLWRLLHDLDIPHATLLDLDAGRSGGGWGRVKIACRELLANGCDAKALFGKELSKKGPEETLAAFDARPLSPEALKPWIEKLRVFGVYFSGWLDLDMLMLRALPDAYRALEPAMKGPSTSGDAKGVVLGEGGTPKIYSSAWDDDFRWYRYLFLGRGKPSTHIRALGRVPLDDLKARAPEELVALLRRVNDELFPTTAPGSGEKAGK